MGGLKFKTAPNLSDIYIRMWIAGSTHAGTPPASPPPRPDVDGQGEPPVRPVSLITYIPLSPSQSHYGTFTDNRGSKLACRPNGTFLNLEHWLHIHLEWLKWMVKHVCLLQTKRAKPESQFEAC